MAVYGWMVKHRAHTASRQKSEVSLAREHTGGGQSDGGDSAPTLLRNENGARTPEGVRPRKA